jgi:hypothetical protein
MLRSRDVPELNLGPEANYTDRFSWFSSFNPGTCPELVTEISHDRFLHYPFQFMIHCSSSHSLRRSASYCQRRQIKQHDVSARGPALSPHFVLTTAKFEHSRS